MPYHGCIVAPAWESSSAEAISSAPAAAEIKKGQFPDLYSPGPGEQNKCATEPDSIPRATSNTLISPDSACLIGFRRTRVYNGGLQPETLADRSL
eukprot:205929-Pelagomonas_calceolata.AAC.1